MSLADDRGFHLWPGRLSPDDQRALVDEVFALAAAGPFYRPMTPGGKPMSVEMTNFGDVGWVTDLDGYRYQSTHPVTGAAWPAMPQMLKSLWDALTQAPAPPDACLVNLYRGDARMGLHQDRDEADFACPVLSVSLGDTAVFRLGGAKRSDPTRSLRLSSGDVMMLAGATRLAHHGVDRILAGSSRLVPGGGRINLTLRRAL